MSTITMTDSGSSPQEVVHHIKKFPNYKTTWPCFIIRIDASLFDAVFTDVNFLISIARIQPFVRNYNDDESKVFNE